MIAKKNNRIKHGLVLVGLLIGVGLMILACEGNNAENSENFSVGTLKIPQNIVKEISANRAIEEVDNDYLRVNIDKFFYDFQNNDGEIPAEELLGIVETRTPDITLEEALDEVDVLFSLFKFGYAGYQYFGGDEVFLAAKERIIERLKIIEDENIGRQVFARMMIDELHFIQDGHVSFKAGGSAKQAFKEYNLLFCEEHQFFMEDNNYYTLIDGEKFYLISVGGENPEESLNLSINEVGEFVYFVSLFSSELGWTHNVTLELERDSDRMIKDIEIELRRMQDKHEDFVKQYELKKVNGIPVININCMHGIPGSDHDLVQFTQDAKKLREEEIIIIDLRGNEGGADIYAQEWINNFTGRQLLLGNFAATLNSTTVLKGRTNIAKSLGIVAKKSHEDSVERIERNIGEEKTPVWDFFIRDEELETIDNNTLVIVLTDSSVASAAESFVLFLRQLNNVIFVGSNTNGVDIIGQTTEHMLPNSYIHLRVGVTMFHNPLRTSAEGIGLKPDFWVPPIHSLERVMKMIKRYDISGFKIDR